MEYKEITLEASDKHSIPVYQWACEEHEVKGVVQLVHGSCEYATRYNVFAKFLMTRGYIVYANDHRGHGKSVNSMEELGYFKDKDGWKMIIEDTYVLTQYIRQNHPNKKIILLGHSMGSFIARHYAIEYGSTIDALILSGTAHYSNLELKLGHLIATKDVKGGKAHNRNKVIDTLSYSSFHRQFRKEKDSFSWLTRDKQIRDDARKDEYFGFKFTSGAFKDMFEGLMVITNENEMAKMPKELPIYILSGANDPVGKNGRMVKKTYELFKKNGMKNVTLKLYPNMRHEILNEIGKEEVYKDILEWIKKQI